MPWIHAEEYDHEEDEYRMYFQKMAQSWDDELKPQARVQARVSVTCGVLRRLFRHKLDMSLAELDLSVRATNCLESEGITTVRDLVSRSEDQLLTVRNFGETTLKEVKNKLSDHGLVLGMDMASIR